MEKKYGIIAICDPYNSFRHYHNQPVLRYNGPTPVEWVISKDLTLQEAENVLDSFASQMKDNVVYEDDWSIKALEDECIDVSWYKGAGWYENGCLIYKHGDDSLRDDVMLYAIREL